MVSTEPLPLRIHTPPEWTDAVLRQPLSLLNDHAHLEKKAAANALELINRWPEPADQTDPNSWVATLTSVARDEIEHLGTVSQLLGRRGGRMTKNHRNPYAASLRRLVRSGQGNAELMDRLMVSTLIELQSCERFDLLGHNCQDKELAELYTRLSVSERGHYRVFVNMARQLDQTEPVDRRWHQMLKSEARIMANQPPTPSMHSWHAL